MRYVTITTEDTTYEPINLDLLARLGACEEEVELFELTYEGDGVMVTPDNLASAAASGLNIWWLRYQLSEAANAHFWENQRAVRRRVSRLLPGDAVLRYEGRHGEYLHCHTRAAAATLEFYMLEILAECWALSVRQWRELEPGIATTLPSGKVADIDVSGLHDNLYPERFISRVQRVVGIW